MSSHSSFHLAVGWQSFSQVDPNSQTVLLAGILLLELRLQLETLLPVKAVQGSEGKRLLWQDALQSCTPSLQQGAACLRGKTRGSPEDLRGQNLEATVVQDAILEGEKSQVKQLNP